MHLFNSNIETPQTPPTALLSITALPFVTMPELLTITMSTLQRKQKQPSTVSPARIGPAL
jgi:hypothetical protein